MESILELIEANYLSLISIWLSAFFIIIYILRSLFSSLLDPILLSVILIISPGIAGVVFTSIIWPGNLDFLIKSVALLFSFLLYIIGMRCGFNYKNSASSDFQLNQEFIWQFLLLILSVTIILLNLFLNGNFDDMDPSKRFANVSFPVLNYFSIAIAGYPAGIFCFTRNIRILYISLICIILITVVQFFFGSSKSFFLSWLFLFLNWHFSRGRFIKKDFYASLKTLSFSYKAIKLIIISIFIGGGGLLLLLGSGVINLINLFIRFSMSFDSAILFLIGENINLNASSDIVGFYSFIDVWLKPFFKNLLGFNFIFENISQYLTYELTGYRATDYSETAWQPNNNMLVDFLILHGYFGVLLSFISGYVVGVILNISKNNHIISRDKFPIFMLLTLSPFYVLTDTQSFVTSLIFGYVLVYGVNFICFVLYGQKK